MNPQSHYKLLHLLYDHLAALITWIPNW